MSTINDRGQTRPNIYNVKMRFVVFFIISNPSRPLVLFFLALHDLTRFFSNRCRSTWWVGSSKHENFYVARKNTTGQSPLRGPTEQTNSSENRANKRRAANAPGACGLSTQIPTLSKKKKNRKGKKNSYCHLNGPEFKSEPIPSTHQY